MAALRIALAALLLASATPAGAQAIARWQAIVAAAAARFDIPVAWVERVMRAESGGRTMLNGRPITSPAGAMGLMQLMPATWAELRGQLDLGPDPHDPADNIMAGAAYLRRMYDRFGYPGLFAAYNAGPGRYAAHLATGRPLPRETRAYLATLVGSSVTPAGRAQVQRDGIFFAAGRNARLRAGGQRKAAGLFALRKGGLSEAR